MENLTQEQNKLWDINDFVKNNDKEYCLEYITQIYKSGQSVFLDVTLKEMKT